MQIKKTVLDNKITLLTDSVSSVESVTMHIGFGVGSRYENKSENGISHFIEHMAFKGTKKRNAKEIADHFEDIGGYFNAFTSRDKTIYYCKFLKEDINLAFELMSDIVINSTFSDIEANKERNVILQELANSIDTPDDIIHDYFQELALPNQSLGRSILGSEENIKSFNKADLQKYYQSHYTGNNTAIAISGNIDHDNITKLCQKYFKNFNSNNNNSKIDAKYSGGSKNYHRDIEQMQIILGYESFARDHKNYYPLQLYNYILGEGMSSKLFQEIREKHGLSYSIYSFNMSYSDIGIFGVHTATTPKNKTKSIKLIREVMQKTAESVTQKELNKAIKSFKTNLLMNLENTASRSRRMISSHLNYGKFISNKELLDNFSKVTKSDIKHAVSDLVKSKETLVTLGKK